MYNTNSIRPLPQLNGKPMLTDGGLETTLIFHNGFDLPYFAAFHQLLTQEGRSAIQTYFETYARLAVQQGVGFIMDTPTWRASREWGRKLGYSDVDLDAANRDAVAIMVDIRNRFETPDSPFIIAGDIGPRCDGYQPRSMMTAHEAEAYHATQVRTFADTECDMLTVLTMTYVEEAVGVARAAKKESLPVAISFTVETDGHLPTGQPLADAIRQVDRETDEAPAYFMINCAHPDHFASVLNQDDILQRRIMGLRANASCLSHAELDEAETLDDGNPVELGQQYRSLTMDLPNLRVFGGCCGTDHRHIGEIAKAIAA